jgi:hypothetical protein
MMVVGGCGDVLDEVSSLAVGSPHSRYSRGQPLRWGPGRAQRETVTTRRKDEVRFVGFVSYCLLVCVRPLPSGEVVLYSKISDHEFRVRVTEMDNCFSWWSCLDACRSIKFKMSMRIKLSRSLSGASCYTQNSNKTLPWSRRVCGRLAARARIQLSRFITNIIAGGGARERQAHLANSAPAHDLLSRAIQCPSSQTGTTGM